MDCIWEIMRTSTLERLQLVYRHGLFGIRALRKEITRRGLVTLRRHAPVAEMEDALDLGSSVLGRESSSLSGSTLVLVAEMEDAVGLKPISFGSAGSSPAGDT